MAHCKDEYSNRMKNYGYTQEEAARKVMVVNEAYKVGSPKSRWAPAKMLPDHRGGYKVVIETIE